MSNGFSSPPNSKLMRFNQLIYFVSLIEMDYGSSKVWFWIKLTCFEMRNSITSTISEVVVEILSLKQGLIRDTSSQW